MTFDSIRFARSTAPSWDFTSERCTKHARKTKRSTMRTARHNYALERTFSAIRAKALNAALAGE